jgi:cysteine synthase B
MGTSRYLKEQNPNVRIVGVRPDDEGGIPGIRAWPAAYQPAIFEPERLDERRVVSKARAEDMTRRLASEEGIFAGVSSGGNAAAAVELAEELEAQGTTDAVIVTIMCDRGDRYLSTDVFQA